MGIVVGAIANYSTKLKFLMRVDDALDLFAEHAIGGIVGLLFNGFFAYSELIALDGVNASVPGGWLNGNWKQLYIQFAYICAVTGYAFVVTAVLAKLVDIIPFLGLRATIEEEAVGMDDAQIGEFANDYIEVRRDYTDWTPAYKGAMGDSESDTIAAAGDRHARPETSLHESRWRQRTGSGGPDAQANGQLPIVNEKPQAEQQV